MKDFSQLSNEFLAINKSTKNLSDKTIIAYSSDLKDFCKYLLNEQMHDGIILDYTNYLFNERHLQETTISRKLDFLTSFFLELLTFCIVTFVASA